MQKVHLLICCLLFSFLVRGQDDGPVVATDTVTLPPYEDVENIGIYYNRETYESARSDSNMVIERLTYLSDGLRVVAFLAKPRDVKGDMKYPVVLYNRGSYIRNDIAFVHGPLFKKFTDNGFIILAPALRGSEGGEGSDEMGGSDLHDIWNALAIIGSRPYMDATNLFVLGESRGGIMTFQILRDGFPARAAATVGAISDMGLYIQENPGLEDVGRQIWSDYDGQKNMIVTQRSAVRWADKIHTPLLLLAGSEDESVNPQHSLDIASQLNKNNREYQLCIFSGGNHILSGDYLDRRDAEVLDWFRGHMK
jgi:dipeptidyl aminopeptidase/acylaminoacyl peptidase